MNNSIGFTAPGGMNTFEIDKDGNIEYARYSHSPHVEDAIGYMTLSRKQMQELRDHLIEWLGPPP